MNIVSAVVINNAYESRVERIPFRNNFTVSQNFPFFVWAVVNAIENITGAFFRGWHYVPSKLEVSTN